MKKRVSCLCLALLLLLSLAACGKQAEERDSAPPTASVQPTPEPTPTPTPPPIPYTDVPEDAPYYDAVVWAYESGIASDGDTFEPDSACTRGQVITFLWRAMGSPEPQITENPVSDVAPSNWFYKPVLWAYESGISTSSTFKPNSPCTNGEALTFLWRAEGKPIAAMHNSAIALAAPNQYFTRPVAWAETNGLLSAEVGFNPSANCLRADLMSYLYWAEEQWTGAAETRALQAEYEQIISDAQIYDVHGSGLIYADYVDVDGDGKVELLTVEIDEEKYNNIVTIYADINGHAGKSCERTFEALVGNRVADFSLCKADGQLYLFASGWYVERAGEYYQYIDKFYRLGKDAVTLEYDLYAEETAVFDEGTYEYLYTAYTYTASSKKVTEGEFKALLEKFTDEKLLYTFDVYGFVIGIEDRGLLPSAEEYYNKWVYPAVLNGDFSFFAGTYKCGYSSIGAESLTLNKDGTLEGGHSRTAINQKPISINVTATGVIQCVIIPIGEIGDFDAGTGEYVGETYDIYPIGVKFNDELYDGYFEAPPSDTGTLRIIYAHWGGTAGPNYSQYYKAP